MEYDAAIAGCGPVGAFCAKLLAEKGFKVVVFEEHKEIGMPEHCSGLIHPRVEDITGMDLGDSVQNEIYGANINFRGIELSLHAESCKSLVLDRAVVDRILAEAAESDGAEIRLGKKASSFVRKSDGIEINGDTKCRVLVGADGVRSMVARSFDMREKAEVIRGIQCNARLKSKETENVSVYLGRDIAPGFFAWAIPTSDDTCRVGLGVNSGSASAYLKRLLDDLDAEPVETFGGGIPLGLMKKSYGDHVVLLGDAAMQVKPISGGGVNMGLRCARICADVLSEALERDDTRESSLARYQREWHKEFAREIRFGMMARKFFYGSSDEKIERLLRAPDEDLLKKISTYGDIDYPRGSLSLCCRHFLLSRSVFIKSNYLSLLSLLPDALRALLN